jgi:predicted nucleic acid-binding protein
VDFLIFDTTFLIDFQRERNAKPGRAHEFLEQNREAGIYLPMIVYGEYAEGFENLSDPAFLSVVESFEQLPITRPIAERYASVTRTLRAEGRLIGVNDLWIAATALEREMPLVTRNLEHFARIPGIQLRSY